MEFNRYSFRLDCNNSTAQQWEIFSGLTEVRVADPELEVKFCLDAIDGPYISFWQLECKHF